MPGEADGQHGGSVRLSCMCAAKVDKDLLARQPAIGIKLCAGQRRLRAAEPVAQDHAHLFRLCPPVASHLIVSLVSVST